MIRRREFITLLGGAAAAWPRAIRAQSSSKRVIANLFAASMTSAAPQIDAILEGLRDLAYVQGRDFEMQHYPAEGMLERLPTLAAEVMLHKPDLILANPTPAIVAARALTQTIPIVSFMITNERELGFVASHARPGGKAARDHVVEGGLMSYGISLRASARRMTTYVDKIFKGAKPAELPLEFPTKLEFVINLATAKALGLDMPASVLARADEVIE